LSGAKQILAGVLTIGGFLPTPYLWASSSRPSCRLFQIGTQITEALAGLERTQEILIEPAEDSDPRRAVTLPAIKGTH